MPVGGAPFRPGSDHLANPFLQVVMRRPDYDIGFPMPVGVVSRTYALVQHLEIAELCKHELDRAGIGPRGLEYQLGLSELGEWMNLQIRLPDAYKFVDQHEQELHLRLECFNSVDGTSPLVVFFRWFRFECQNGMVTEQKIQVRRRHGQGLRLDAIRYDLRDAFESVEDDRQRMRNWAQERVEIDDIRIWTREYVAEAWNQTAAARVFYICSEGWDVEISQPFEKPSRHLIRVPGSPEMAATLYDVSQALSYVATRRTDVEERMKWQEHIPRLLNELPATREVYKEDGTM